MAERPDGITADFPLARLTTVRSGGRAEYFARPGTIAALQEMLAWAADEALSVAVIGSGSNLLIADLGVPGLVLKLDAELAAFHQGGAAADAAPGETDPASFICGGGARLPTVSAAAARAGLSGIEFGVSIPGTVGGAVRMNANAYGGALARVLSWVDVVDAAGVHRRRPEQLDFRYRRSNLVAGEVVARACFTLTPAPAATVKATLADLRDRRKVSQPAGIKTFGSTFKNPDDPRAEGRTAGQLLDAAGCRGLRVGDAGFSAKHANFVENFGAATTADIVTLMVAGRDRVRERFGVTLEPEVQALGPVQLPPEWRH